MTPNNITKGFQSTGIYPLNTDIFSEEDYLASAVTDRPNPKGVRTQGGDKTSSSSTLVPRTLTPTNPDISTDVASNEQPSTTSVYVRPHDIIPLPVAQPRKPTRAGRRRKRSAILTETPEKDR